MAELRITPEQKRQLRIICDRQGRDWPSFFSGVVLGVVLGAELNINKASAVEKVDDGTGDFILRFPD